MCFLLLILLLGEWDGHRRAGGGEAHYIKGALHQNSKGSVPAFQVTYDYLSALLVSQRYQTSTTEWQECSSNSQQTDVYDFECVRMTHVCMCVCVCVGVCGVNLQQDPNA